ncbi:MAG: ABC transporter ATP-binding protein [Phycisphaerae bacterium]|nr:ABC transporter ATP-binding protein [Phycisphaerae bacterium]
MIELKQLVKRFGPFTAVDGVTFRVNTGEVVGFLGPNGAGKSTTMKMVAGYLTPTSGSASVAGHEIASEPLAVKRVLGYLPEGAPAYPDMTPESFLRFVAQIRGLRGAAARERIAHVVGLVHLEGVMRQPIETLSKGFKRRVGLAQAILHDPAALIMDEPTDGLDPNQKHEVRTLIRSMASTKAVILSTHILEEVEAVCTRVVLINRGRIVFDGTPREFQQKSRHAGAVRVQVRAAAEQREAIARELRSLGSAAGVEEVGGTDGRFECVVLAKNREALPGEITRAARGKGWELESVAVEPGRLDEVFRSMTTGGAR